MLIVSNRVTSGVVARNRSHRSVATAPSRYFYLALLSAIPRYSDLFAFGLKHEIGIYHAGPPGRYPHCQGRAVSNGSLGRDAARASE